MSKYLFYNVNRETGEGLKKRGQKPLETIHFDSEAERRRSNGAKGLPGVIHGTQVTLCCAHKVCCKHRDKPWFSWHPAAAEHGQNEQKKQMCGETQCQRVMQQKRMTNAK